MQRGRKQTGFSNRGVNAKVSFMPPLKSDHLYRKPEIDAPLTRPINEDKKTKTYTYRLTRQSLVKQELPN